MNLSVQVAPCAMLVGMFHPFLVYLTPWCSFFLSLLSFFTAWKATLSTLLATQLHSLPRGCIELPRVSVPLCFLLWTEQAGFSFVSPVWSVPQGHLWFYMGHFVLSQSPEDLWMVVLKGFIAPTPFLREEFCCLCWLWNSPQCLCWILLP